MKILVLLLALLTVCECDRTITRRAGKSITLPCRYDIKVFGPTPVCWGRGHIPLRGCINQLLATDGHKVKEETRLSSRYQLKGSPGKGDVSLTIVNATEEDSGLYGCRVEIPGPFNDEKHHINLIVKTEMDCKDEEVVAYAGQDVTLPCKYNKQAHGLTPVCWGHEFTILGCTDEILNTDGFNVTEQSRASNRYQLLGNLTEGDVSLTIRSVTEEDTGQYACRVMLPGFFNDEKYYVDLSVVKAPPSTVGQGQQRSRTDYRTHSRK